MSDDQIDNPNPSDAPSITNVSGGVNVDAARDVNIGGDVVGRDKVTLIQHIYAQPGESPRSDWYHLLCVFLESAVTQHRFHSLAWRSDVSGNELPLEEVYIEPRLYPIEDPASARAQIPGRTMSIERAMQQDSHLVILGEPGVGKSILLHRLGLQLAQHCRIDPAGAVTEGYVPLFVSLRDYGSEEQDRPKGTALDHLWSCIDPEALGLAAVLQPLMQQGRVVVLFDALDELNNPELRLRVLRKIQTLAGGVHCPMILTSREAAYRGSVLQKPFKTYRLLPLDPAGQSDAIQRWMPRLRWANIQDEGQTGRQIRALQTELVKRPGLRQTLYNPLLLRLTLLIYKRDEPLPRLSQRYERFVDHMLGQPKGDEQAKRRLQELAFEMHNQLGRLSVEDAHNLLKDRCGLSLGDAADFLSHMEERAGLLVVHARTHNRYDYKNCFLAFAPHQTFQDYFVGRYLAHLWKKNRRLAASLLHEKADQPDWQPAILRCLSLLDDKAAWDVILHELGERPLWGARCLQEGLELTCAELENTDPKRLKQVYKKVAAQADKVLHPGLHTITLNLRRIKSAADSETAWNKQYEAIRALGNLQIPGTGLELLIGGFRNTSPERNYMMPTPFRDALVSLGPKYLWDEIREVALKHDNEQIRWEAARIVTRWRGPEAFEPLCWVWKYGDNSHTALQGLAVLGTPEADAAFQEALREPSWRLIAIQAGMKQQYPGLLEDAVKAVQTGEFAYYQIRDVFEYLIEQPLDLAVPAMETLLRTEVVTSKLNDVFEGTKEFVLPMLRVLVRLLRHPDPAIVKKVNDAIPRVLKGGDIDPYVGDGQAVLEQLLLNAGEGWLQDAAAKMLRTATLSDSTCETLLERFLAQPESDRWAMIDLSVSLPPLPSAYRQRFIDALRPGLQNDETRFGINLALARLNDDPVIPDIVRELEQSSSPDSRLLEALVRMGATEAFPYLRAILSKADRGTNEWDTKKWLLGMVLIAPRLKLEEREEVARILQSQLAAESWHLRMAAVYGLGELCVKDATSDILNVLTKSDLPQEEAVVGFALGRMGWCDDLAEQLAAAFEKKDGHTCGAVVHAWGSMGHPQSVSPLLSALNLPANFLRSTNIIGMENNLDSALLYLKARIAMALARLAVTLAESAGGKLDMGWNTLLGAILFR